MQRAILALAFALTLLQASAQEAGKPLNPWQEGDLEIHFIHTGRGNAAYYILPDATTLLVDAGELDPTNPRTHSRRNTPLSPDYTRFPYEWIADYIRQNGPKDHKDRIDYAWITHFHDDHYGSLYAGAPKAEQGDYYLTGITGVGTLLPIGKLIDRGFDDPLPYAELLKKYESAYPGYAEKGNRSLDNYLAFVAFQEKMHKLEHESVRVGDSGQISLRHNKARYPDFKLTPVYANGKVWSAAEQKKLNIYPRLDTVDFKKWPGENQHSAGFKLSYGPFDFVTCGDISGIADLGAPDWFDVESKVAPYIGEIDACTLNHHGNRDGTNETWLRTLKPRILIEEVWSSDHPGHEVLRRMTSQYVYPGSRDLFATNMLEPNKEVIGPGLEKAYQSDAGHIVIRVAKGGAQYQVIILDHRSAKREVKHIFGPYQAK